MEFTFSDSVHHFRFQHQVLPVLAGYHYALFPVQPFCLAHLEKDPVAICASCPYCMTMLEDGLKDLNTEGKVRVLDLTEIVARVL